MNYYFLLEDEKSFIKVLPKWLSYMGFSNDRVPDISFVTKNCYVLQSGQGVTQLITQVLFQTIDTLIQNPKTIDELIVILDSEEYDTNYRKDQVLGIINEYIGKKGLVIDFSYKVFVCNHCFETWLLGNGTLYPQIRPDDDFRQYYDTYNIQLYDPEKMRPPEDVDETIAIYHFHYLHEMCRHNKIRYSKKNPMNLATKEYFQEIIVRISTTNDLPSFLEFYSYFLDIGTEKSLIRE